MKNSNLEERICQEFDSFCKVVLKNEAIDYERRAARNRKRAPVRTFSELSVRDLNQILSLDKYSTDYAHFDAQGYAVSISDDTLAEAIATLPTENRDIILLSYFLDMTDGEIAAKLNLIRSTTVQTDKLPAGAEKIHRG